jgi:hypothetical protein
MEWGLRDGPHMTQKCTQAVESLSVRRLAAYGEPVEGTPFGRYRLVELLGRGGMGEVWRAHDTAANNRTVAIKLLPPQMAADPKFVVRFRREADSAAQLNNPHVIPIHNYGEIDGRLYVDMRLVEGRDLHELLAEGPLEPGRAVRIIEGVALALQAAHKVGLVHRDVKPSNILLDENDFAYLIDFGIARGAEQTGLTGTGAIIGSWPYMSPERFRAGQVDARADVYALACVLYECLTGRTPFPGDSVEQQIAAHLMAPTPRASSTERNVPVKFDRVIATGMAKDPDERYQAATDLAQAARVALTLPAAQPQLSFDAAAALRKKQSPAAATATLRKAGGHSPQAIGQQGSVEPASPAPLRWWRRKVRHPAIVLAVPTVLCIAAIVFAGLAVRVSLPDWAEADAERAVVQTATDAITTLWTYTPDDIDGLADRAAKYLDSDFGNQYAKFVGAIVAPNKQAKMTNKSQVVGAGVESLSGSEATVIVYTNTTSTSPTTQPQIKYLSYRLFMHEHDSAWLIKRMTTITSTTDSERKFPVP